MDRQYAEQVPPNVSIGPEMGVMATRGVAGPPAQGTDDLTPVLCSFPSLMVLCPICQQPGPLSGLHTHFAASHWGHPLTLSPTFLAPVSRAIAAATSSHSAQQSTMPSQQPTLAIEEMQCTSSTLSPTTSGAAAVAASSRQNAENVDTAWSTTCGSDPSQSSDDVVITAVVTHDDSIVDDPVLAAMQGLGIEITTNDEPTLESPTLADPPMEDDAPQFSEPVPLVNNGMELLHTVVQNLDRNKGETGNSGVQRFTACEQFSCTICMSLLSTKRSLAKHARRHAVRWAMGMGEQSSDELLAFLGKNFPLALSYHSVCVVCLENFGECYRCLKNVALTVGSRLRHIKAHHIPAGGVVDTAMRSCFPPLDAATQARLGLTKSSMPEVLGNVPGSSGSYKGTALRKRKPMQLQKAATEVLAQPQTSSSSSLPIGDGAISASVLLTPDSSQSPSKADNGTVVLTNGTMTNMENVDDAAPPSPTGTEPFGLDNDDSPDTTTEQMQKLLDEEEPQSKALGDVYCSIDALDLASTKDRHVSNGYESGQNLAFAMQHQAEPESRSQYPNRKIQSAVAEQLQSFSQPSKVFHTLDLGKDAATSITKGPKLRRNSTSGRMISKPNLLVGMTESETVTVCLEKHTQSSMESLLTIAEKHRNCAELSLPSSEIQKRKEKAEIMLSKLNPIMSRRKRLSDEPDDRKPANLSALKYSLAGDRKSREELHYSGGPFTECQVDRSAAIKSVENGSSQRIAAAGPASVREHDYITSSVDLSATSRRAKVFRQRQFVVSAALRDIASSKPAAKRSLCPLPFKKRRLLTNSSPILRDRRHSFAGRPADSTENPPSSAKSRKDDHSHGATTTAGRWVANRTRAWDGLAGEDGAARTRPVGWFCPRVKANAALQATFPILLIKGRQNRPAINLLSRQQFAQLQFPIGLDHLGRKRVYRRRSERSARMGKRIWSPGANSPEL